MISQRKSILKMYTITMYKNHSHIFSRFGRPRYLYETIGGHTRLLQVHCKVIYFYITIFNISILVLYMIVQNVQWNKLILFIKNPPPPKKSKSSNSLLDGTHKLLLCCWSVIVCIWCRIYERKNLLVAINSISRYNVLSVNNITFNYM